MTPLERLALRSVPRDWREAIAAAIDEEGLERSGAWRAAHIARIGCRLRVARVRDSLADWSVNELQGGFPMRDSLRDLRLAARGLRRQPWQAAAIVATLAIGIGANAAIFSIFNWILFRPVPGVTAPDRLFTVRFQTPQSSGRFFVPYLDYAGLRDGVSAFEGLAGSLPLTVHLAEEPGAEGVRIDAEIVTTNYFAVLGAAPPLGRAFVDGEEHALDGPPPVVLAHSLWHSRFHRDPSVIGSTIWIDGTAFSIVGIAPRGFQGRSLAQPSGLWAPVGAHPALLPHYGSRVLTARGQTFFGDAFGRLRAGVTLQQAQAEASSFAETTPEFATRVNRPRSSIRPILTAGLGYDTWARERLTTAFNLLMGAVGLVLLLACANAGNLLLARATARRREIAVRQAIGAGRLRIVRQQLAEGLLLALLAGGAGLALAVWLTSLFNGMRILTFLPEIEGVAIDMRVAGFALAASLLSALLFATAPAIAGSRVDVLAALKDGQTSSRRGRQALRGALVMVQITVSLVLLTGALLLVRTLVNIRSLDLGLNLHGLVGFLADPSRLGHEPERAQQMLREIAARLAGAPGIAHAAVTWSTPYGNARADLSLARLDAPDASHSAQTTAVSPGYFATMGIPLLAGRDFTDAEFGRLNTTDGVIILSRRLADAIFPEGGALGSRLRVSYPANTQVEVVGIVGDVRSRPITNEPEAVAYEPGGQRWRITWGHIVARSSLPSAQVSAVAREVLRDVDPAFTPPLVESFESMIDRTLAEQRLFARLGALFAAIAALLAAIGIYAMMAGAVGERTREFGIRLALGARGASVVRLVLRHAFAVVAIGLSAGLGVTFMTTRALESRLFGVTPLDPWTLGSACVVLAALAFTATLLPAWRATRADPVAALRSE